MPQEELDIATARSIVDDIITIDIVSAERLLTAARHMPLISA